MKSEQTRKSEFVIKNINNDLHERKYFNRVDFINIQSRKIRTKISLWFGFPTSEWTSLHSDFCLHKNQSRTSSFLLFRKKSRLARMFGCKHPRNGSLSLPTFCEHAPVGARVSKPVTPTKKTTDSIRICRFFNEIRFTVGEIILTHSEIASL